MLNTPKPAPLATPLPYTYRLKYVQIRRRERKKNNNFFLFYIFFSHRVILSITVKYNVIVLL